MKRLWHISIVEVRREEELDDGDLFVLVQETPQVSSRQVLSLRGLRRYHLVKPRGQKKFLRQR